MIFVIMKRRWLAVLAAASLVAAAMLLCGYFGQVGIALINNDVAAARQTVLQFSAEDGRVVLRHHAALSPAAPFGPDGSRARFVFRFGRLPSLRRSVWEFDAHRLWLASAGQLTIVACPIWCLLLPSLVAPMLWLRRWRSGRRPRKGFDVLLPNDPPPPPPTSMSTSTPPSSPSPATS
jgi:hypothetical protein